MSFFQPAIGSRIYTAVIYLKRSKMPVRDASIRLAVFDTDPKCRPFSAVHVRRCLGDLTRTTRYSSVIRGGVWKSNYSRGAAEAARRLWLRKRCNTIKFCARCTPQLARRMFRERTANKGERRTWVQTSCCLQILPMHWVDTWLGVSQEREFITNHTNNLTTQQSFAV